MVAPQSLPKHPDFTNYPTGPRKFSISEIAFHEKAGPSQVDSVWVLLDKVFSPAEFAAVAMLPFALCMSVWFRSVHVAPSAFSRCSYLFGALWIRPRRIEPGPGD